MRKVAEAMSHGAISIVNAMATGMGAALGVGLWTRARVTLTDHSGSFRGRILGDPNEDTSLIETTARRVFREFGTGKKVGALIETQSNIPIAVGLKSSSAASNAVTLASLRVLGKRIDDIQTVKIGVDASLQAGVTLTGAYDDACACYFGGIIVTDNTQSRILKHFKPTGNLRVLIHIPNGKRYSGDVNRASLRKIKPFVQEAYHEALRGNYWDALTLNGLAYSKELGYGSASVLEAVKAGAIAAGLTGKGPAIAAIVPKRKVDKVLSAWRSLRDRVIETSFNFEKAKELGAS